VTSKKTNTQTQKNEAADLFVYN